MLSFSKARGSPYHLETNLNQVDIGHIYQTELICRQWKFLFGENYALLHCSFYKLQSRGIARNFYILRQELGLEFLHIEAGVRVGVFLHTETGGKVGIFT